jgi:SPP1 gp7 family putative phage head morphogenesis protein
LTNYQELPLPEGQSLTEYLAQYLPDKHKTRARTIARDQTSKVNTALMRARCEEIGSEEYIWRTAGDSRVTGNPNGLYPDGNKTHGNHYARNGNKFRWAEPPSDGHPGYAINCRCVAEPIVDIEKLKYV